MPTRQAGDWTVALGTAKDLPAAQEMVRSIRALSPGIEPFVVARRNPADFLVGVGRFADPLSAEARGLLGRVRELDANGRKPFSSSVMTPIGVAPVSDGNPEFDLARVGEDPAKQTMIYTLQVAVYARPDNQRPSAAELKEFRKAAEDAASKLRAEGEEAYYSHGQTKSMVTVGTFGPGDYDPARPRTGDSEALRATRGKFKYHMVNGQGRRVGGRLEEPFLVEIPR